MPRGGKRNNQGGRPPSERPLKRITVTLPDELVEWIDKHSTNRSKYITELIESIRDEQS